VVNNRYPKEAILQKFAIVGLPFPSQFSGIEGLADLFMGALL
jgi:hypothetical protein